MPKVAIATVDLFAARRHWNPVLLRIIETVFPGSEGPLAPRSNDLEFWSQRLVCELKAHLVIPLSGTAMRDRGSSFLQSHFDLTLGDDWTGERSAKQILVFVNRACPKRRKHIVDQKRFPQVFDDDFAGARRISLVDDRLQIVALAYVADHGDHVMRKVFFQPRNNDGSVKASRIGKHDFVRHGRSLSADGSCRLPVIKAEWPSAREPGFLPGRRRRIGVNR